jgi:hypothetical protein
VKSPEYLPVFHVWLEEAWPKRSRKYNRYDKLLKTDQGEMTMLGKHSKQQGLFESDHLYMQSVGEDSFYGRVNPWPANETRLTITQDNNDSQGEVNHSEQNWKWYLSE